MSVNLYCKEFQTGFVYIILIILFVDFWSRVTYATQMNNSNSKFNWSLINGWMDPKSYYLIGI